MTKNFLATSSYPRLKQTVEVIYISMATMEDNSRGIVLIAGHFLLWHLTQSQAEMNAFHSCSHHFTSRVSAGRGGGRLSPSPHLVAFPSQPPPTLCWVSKSPLKDIWGRGGVWGCLRGGSPHWITWVGLKKIRAQPRAGWVVFKKC